MIISILLLTTASSLAFSFFYYKKRAKVNYEIEERNFEKEKQNALLEAQKISLKEELNKLCSERDSIQFNIKNSYSQFDALQREIDSVKENHQKISEEAFQNWWKLLEEDYQKKEEEYKNLTKNLEEKYAEKQLKLLSDLDEVRGELNKISATRDAALAAQIKEKEIKEKLSFYCLSVNEKDLDDIKKLENIKSELHSPRILSMLIWSTYFQKPMTSLCNNILGASPVCGIYKITNQKTGECYIGQAGTSMADRWKQHAKCGLGIDTPVGNKLYKAMKTEGIWNFSWELLEKCPKEELNEKEKFYIKLYKSYEWGYNSNSGIGKGEL